MAQQTFKELLKSLGACQDAFKWAGDMTIEQVVKDCHRGDWLLWLAFRIDINKRNLSLTKGHCVNTVKHLMKDERSIKAIDAIIDYGNGLIDDDKLKTAAADAVVAADAADASVAAYAAAAYAAVAADAYVAAYAAAACAAYAAVAAAADADAAAYAKKQNQMQTADICREHIGEFIINRVNELLNK